MGMLPHERSLVKKYEGRPFALLGVDTNDSLDDVQDLAEQGKITWRNWYDKDGKTARQWGVQMFPTIYLIDHKGVIQQKHIGPPDADFEALLEKLLREAQNDKTS